MSYIGNPINSVAFLTDQFSGNGTTTAFTTSVAPANTASVLVAISGVVQDPTTYSVSGTTLTFSAAPPGGTGNISVRYLGVPASGVTTTAYRTITEFTATAGQTTFSTPSYTVGYLNVFQNGVRLGAADFTATSGTTVVLATGAAAGDLITTESFYVSSVLNAIPATAGAVTQTYLAPNVAGNGPAFSAYQSTPQTISALTATKINFQTEEWDTNSNFASSRFTPTVAGYYHIVAGAAPLLGAYSNIYIAKNGTEYKRGNQTAGGGQYLYSCLVSGVVYLNGSTDYVEIYCYADANTFTASTQQTYFQGFLARAA